ncbi:MAG: D-mannonate epimerase [Verrucomicrobia bacterium]|nr:D-mannonate epimerase [Verrucomicrobiota bacterium]MCH8510433.1 D-mannonate epimerase [Kiritimatiellia bacterium]
MNYISIGSADTVLTDADLRQHLFEALKALGPKRKVLAVPPDFTRLNSRAGPLTCMTHDFYGEALVDVMPALGTHVPMPDWQLDRMYPNIPKSLIREHDWRNDVVTVGEVPSEFVSEVTEGIYTKAWPAQMNKLLWEGGHDLILSIGQVVPHEVIGMANYTKNIFVGTGGVAGINESHFIGAAYGMERMMGRADTPLRRILNEAADRFCTHLPLVYVLTVIGPDGKGGLVTRGLYIGDDHDTFERAAALSLEVNFNMLEEAPDKVVVYLDPEEFHSTWLGNKSIYRTRMAIADGGELVVLAPEVGTFGEDKEIDRLIRKYGYRTTPEVMKAVEENEDLRNNLSAAAHLIHGSSEERFKVTYCPGKLTREEIEGVGYAYGDLETQSAKYPIRELKDGWNERNGERFYYISNPALGLWAHRDRFIS